MKKLILSIALALPVALFAGASTSGYIPDGTSIINTAGVLSATAFSVGAPQGLIPTAVKSGGYTLAAGDFVPVDCSGGTVALLLPNAPADKTRCAVKVIAISGAHVTTLACQGSDTYNVATTGSTSMTLSLLNQAMTVQYVAATKVWYAINTDLALTQLDARFSPIAGSSSIVTVGSVAAGSLGAAVTGTTAAVGDNTTAVATDAFANAAGRAAFVGTLASPDTAAGALTLVSPVTIVYTSAAGGVRTYTLPAAAAGNEGMAVEVVCSAAGNHINFQPYSGDIFYVNGAAITVNYYLQDASPAVGDYAVAVSDGAHWSFEFGTGYIGSWAAAASP